MPRFASYDGTGIGYRVAGDGPPLVCLPGRPGRAAEYLGDLGGLTPEARVALYDILAGDRSMASYRASRPFFYARWDDAAQAHAMLGIADRHAAAREGYFAGAEFDIPATTAAVGRLTALTVLKKHRPVIGRRGSDNAGRD